MLGRTHRASRPVEAAAEARAAGFERISLDLIYGTPGESDTDWEASLDAVIGSGVGHVSAYALTIEPRTPLARRISTGSLPAPDADRQACRYRRADARLRAAGFDWYELSNWARTEADRCRHNQRYWWGADWLGVGPGAHSHVGGHRWWNDPDPGRWAGAVRAGRSPAAGEERLTPDQQALEQVMLGIRLTDGLPLDQLDVGAVTALRADGLARPVGDRLVLTLTGRLLADAVIRRLA